MLRGAHRYERRCTCGAIAAECPVWGPMLRWLDDHDDQALPIKMQQLVQIVSRLDGPTPELIVDSYQDDFVLPLDNQSELNRLVLHLTRDVRSWVHSRSRSKLDRGARFAEWRPLLRWARTNSRHETLLNRSIYPLFRLGYEELALDLDTSLSVCVSGSSLIFQRPCCGRVAAPAAISCPAIGCDLIPNGRAKLFMTGRG